MTQGDGGGISEASGQLRCHGPQEPHPRPIYSIVHEDGAVILQFLW